MLTPSNAHSIDSPASRYTIPSLFHEIIDAIIDHLHDDKPSLGACGLTCRAWLPTTRFHLFSEVVLTRRKSSSFLALLDAPSPSGIADLVQNISLKSFNQSSQDDMVVDIPQLGSRLPSVTVLQLCISDLSDFSTEDINQIFSSFRNVEKFILDRVLLRNLDHTLDIIYAFPSLRQISIYLVNWLSPILNQLPLKRLQHGPQFVMDEVFLGLWNLKHVAEWLLVREPVPTIHTLHVGLLEATPEGYTALHSLLRVVGYSIQVLKLNFGTPISEPEGFDQPIDLQHCTGLKVIKFGGILLRTIVTVEHHNWLANNLQQVMFDCIEELHFSLESDVSPEDRDFFIEFDWEGIAHVLKRPQFARLRKLCVRWKSVSKTSDLEGAERYLRNGHLSAYSDRGVLELDFKRGHNFGYESF